MAALFTAPAATFPIGRFICHQRPERSFAVNGHQLAVCARCTGLYVGAAAAAPLALAAAGLMARGRARRLLAVAALPTMATWMAEFVVHIHVTNGVRFIAALPLGFCAAWLVIATLAEAAPRGVRSGQREGA